MSVITNREEKDGEIYSSAPAYESVYKPEDYNEDGSLKVLKPIPLGNYPAFVEGHSFAPVPAVFNAHDVDDEGFKRPDPRPEKKKVEEEEGGGAKKGAAFGDSVVKCSNFSSQFTAADVGVKGNPVPNEDPEDSQHYVCVLSYVENRHPDEERILLHYYRQWVAKRNGTYDPLNDPPVYLSAIIPKLVVKCGRTFTRDEYNTEGLVAKYVEGVHARTDMTIVPILCGKLQVLPVSDMVQGKYNDAALEQQMRSFYENHARNAEAMMDRMERDQKEAHDAWLKQRDLTEKERRGEIDPPPPLPVEEDPLSEAQRKAAEKQKEWRRTYDIKTKAMNDQTKTWYEVTEEEEAKKGPSPFLPKPDTSKLQTVNSKVKVKVRSEDDWTVHKKKKKKRKPRGKK